MIKPDWCPQRLWDEALKADASATEACLNALGDTSPTIDAAHEASVAAIARAIMAAEQREREACARFGAAGMSRAGTDPWARGYRCASADIYESIRNRGENQGD